MLDKIASFYDEEVNVAVDTLTSVSRTTLRRIAKALGFSETQAVHFALA